MVGIHALLFLDKQVLANLLGKNELFFVVEDNFQGFVVVESLNDLNDGA